ncbi:hypothetical protein EVJ58_g3304 [Rhodofomes roseus]|uniref:Arf-GAP domain-containing protein n=1 Tax=Rhodofomes roseus TaxID=34475 RepID=A0A4Y9YNG0_9APHY|nr:hypothetical protein EVJ58_g3304 [Rhodofomes roseus]
MNKISAERNQRALLELANSPGNGVLQTSTTSMDMLPTMSRDRCLCGLQDTQPSLGVAQPWDLHLYELCEHTPQDGNTYIEGVCTSPRDVVECALIVNFRKSLTMDTWTREQVEHMKNNGNVKSNAYYNPDEKRHPPPTNMIDSERDSDLENQVRVQVFHQSRSSSSGTARTFKVSESTIAWSAGTLTSSPRSCVDIVRPTSRPSEDAFEFHARTDPCIVNTIPACDDVCSKHVLAHPVPSCVSACVKLVDNVYAANILRVWRPATTH